MNKKELPKIFLEIPRSFDALTYFVFFVKKLGKIDFFHLKGNCLVSIEKGYISEWHTINMMTIRNDI